MEATALSVLPNKIPKEDLEAFYDYCKENPKAKEAVDAVIKAFSPDTISTFIENCAKYPLPTDPESFKDFCKIYTQEIDGKKEAPKKETGIAETRQEEH